MKRVSLSKYVELALRRADYEKGESFDCVVAEALDLPGCLTQGRTFEEARENLKDAIELWITVCLSKGEVLPLIDGCTVAGAPTKSPNKRAYAKA
jgi:predicted RNase H-like HicB family nuclease